MTSIMPRGNLSIILATLICGCLVTVSLSQTRCELDAVNECLSAYIQGFQNESYSRYHPVKLHCMLDEELARCSDKYLERGCSGEVLQSLGRAVLSYARYDRQNGLCRWPGYYPLLKKLVSNEANIEWMKKYDYLVYHCKYSACSREVDKQCIIAFVKRMRVKADLCEFIPFKYNCLRRMKEHCQADILNAVLDIFPKQADNVLKVLCKNGK